MNNKKNLTVYMAGPDVFYPNALDVACQKKDILSKKGFIGLHPFDNEVIGAGKIETGRLISQKNKETMDKADIILANLTPFRGPNVDDGTAFEIEYMDALKKPVFAYSNVALDFCESVSKWNEEIFGAEPTIRDDGLVYDDNNYLIEDFNYHSNLMIGQTVEGRFSCLNTNIDQITSCLKAFETVVNMMSKERNDGTLLFSSQKFQGCKLG